MFGPGASAGYSGMPHGMMGIGMDMGMHASGTMKSQVELCLVEGEVLYLESRHCRLSKTTTIQLG